MTTRVQITCPDTSHWDAKVTVEDQTYDFEAEKMTDKWHTANVIVLKPTERTEQYVTSSRRLVIEEVER